MNDDERQARIDAIKARTSSRVNPCTVNLTDARWLLSELDAATAREARLREALRELVACVFTGDEGRLLMVGLAGSNVSPELRQWCDRVTAAPESARAALAEGA